MEQVKHTSLAAALLAAQGEISMIQKDASNEHHGFNYASADGIISQTKAVLNRNGLVFRSGGRKTEWLGVQTETRSGKGGSTYEVPVPRAVVTITVTVSHPDSGQEVSETHSLIAEADRGRPIDKAILGVETTMIGYALRGLLNLPRFDNESQVCGRDDTAYAPDMMGQETAQALVEGINRIGQSVQFVKRKLIDSGDVEADAIKGPVATWPKSLIARIQAGIDRASEAQAKQRAQIQSLPQRREDGLVVDPSTSQIEPEPPEPTPSRSNGNSKSKPASSKTAPASFGNEMAKLIP